MRSKLSMPNGVKNDWERLSEQPSKQKEFRSHQAQIRGRLAKIVNPTELRSGQILNTSLTIVLKCLRTRVVRWIKSGNYLRFRPLSIRACGSHNRWTTLITRPCRIYLEMYSPNTSSMPKSRSRVWLYLWQRCHQRPQLDTGHHKGYRQDKGRKRNRGHKGLGGYDEEEDKERRKYHWSNQVPATETMLLPQLSPQWSHCRPGYDK